MSEVRSLTDLRNSGYHPTRSTTSKSTTSKPVSMTLLQAMEQVRAGLISPNNFYSCAPQVLRQILDNVGVGLHQKPFSMLTTDQQKALVSEILTAATAEPEPPKPSVKGFWRRMFGKR